MDQEPIQEARRLMEGIFRPHGGLILLFVAPLVLILGGVLMGWLAYRLPQTTYALMTYQIIGLAGLLEAFIVWIMLLLVIPQYNYFAKRAIKALNVIEVGEERYVRALTGSHLGFWDLDIEQQQVFFSPHMMAMLGYGDHAKLETLDFWMQSIHPEDVDGVKRAMEFHLDRRTPEYSIEYRMRRANGEYLWVYDRGEVHADTNGKHPRLSGVSEDISNIKRVQEVLESRTNELEEAKNKIEQEIQNVRKFQKVVDSSTEAVSITNPDGAIMNGYTEDEAMGRNPKLLKSGTTKPEVYVAMWEKITAGLAFSSEEITNKRKDGTIYQAELSIFPIREGDQNFFYVSLCQDITLRKEVDRAKTEFVSLASHQLRTPLSAIRWYSEMLLSKYVGDLNEKQRQYVKEIYAGNLRMVELVNALLNVSRIDLGTIAVDPEPVSLVEICESVLMELTPQITEKQQTIEKLFVAAPATYMADSKLIRIVFQNFLSNSVKYTQPGGHIAVEISARENQLYIRVSDNGYGIPKAQHGKMFEKLFRADNVRQKDTEGTGLGMYIVKAVVESSNGRIWFESEENQGTTFHVLMPLSGMIKKSGMKGLS
jgi:PAS domain S-box-containing protein